MKPFKTSALSGGQETVKNVIRRLVIYPKDVESILGYQYPSACNFLRKMKKKLGKPRHQFITVSEFCAYTGIEEVRVREMMRR
jgi:hypothetical protein